MKKTNCLYEAPTTEILVLRIEEGILTISGGAGGTESVFNDDDY